MFRILPSLEQLFVQTLTFKGILRDSNLKGSSGEPVWNHPNLHLGIPTGFEFYQSVSCICDLPRCVLNARSSWSIIPSSDSSRLTGNQVTSLTSLQMLSENRLVCQEAVYSLFQTQLSFVCLGTPSAAPGRLLSSPSFSTL